MNKSELVIMLRATAFGDRGTDIEAALDYCDSLIEAMSEASCRAPAYAALHVVLNTVANAIEALPEYVNRISPEDNPAAGAPEPEPVMLTLDRAALDQIIDARIANWYEHEFDIQGEIEQGINNYDFEDTIRDTIRHNISFSIDVD